MTTYKNLGRDSAVSRYNLGDGYIQVEFQHTKVYTYTNASAGKNNILHMQNLAVVGQGLGSFINRNVKNKYASKS